MLYDGPGDLVKVFDCPDYGPLWSDRYPIALVAHTTETKGKPDYNGGSWAPQVTLDPFRFVCYQHQYLDRRSGALRGTKKVHDDTGVWTVMNEKAVQAEIIGYSDRAQVERYKDGRVWVGDFGDEQYRFLAEAFAWLQSALGIGDALHARPSGQSWAYGVNSPHRLGATDWEQFSGLTAHGGVFGQIHWDTGVLDLHRLWNPDQGEHIMRTKEFVYGLKQGVEIDEAAGRRTRLHRMFDAGLIGPNTKQAYDYWRGMLADFDFNKPLDPAFYNLVNAAEVEAWISATKKPVASTSVGEYSITLHGTATPKS